MSAVRRCGSCGNRLCRGCGNFFPREVELDSTLGDDEADGIGPGSGRWYKHSTIIESLTVLILGILDMQSESDNGETLSDKFNIRMDLDLMTSSEKDGMVKTELVIVCSESLHKEL